MAATHGHCTWPAARCFCRLHAPCSLPLLCCSSSPLHSCTPAQVLSMLRYTEMDDGVCRMGCARTSAPRRHGGQPCSSWRWGGPVRSAQEAVPRAPRGGHCLGTHGERGQGSTFGGPSKSKLLLGWSDRAQTPWLRSQVRSWRAGKECLGRGGPAASAWAPHAWAAGKKGEVRSSARAPQQPKRADRKKERKKAALINHGGRSGRAQLSISLECRRR